MQPKSELRRRFFDLLFGDQEGWLCIATKRPRTGEFRQKFFKYPLHLKEAEEYILGKETSNDVYFCVNLLEHQERNKENCLPSRIVWADIDEVLPSTIKPEPQIVIQTSLDRFQALWRLTIEVAPHIAEGYAKRIAYASGADNSGWDLTQLLRVPFSKNFKYGTPQEVVLERALEIQAAPLLFEALPALPVTVVDDLDIDVPASDDLPPVEAVVYKYSHALKNTAFRSLMSEEPDRDWSKRLWRLIHLCMDAGMTNDETLVICKNSKVNKYDRDNRPLSHLWRDILKADASRVSLEVLTGQFRGLMMPRLCEEPPQEGGFIDRYREWASEATDAVVDFHDLCSTILLSSVISNSVRLDTSYGTMVPNLWGLILGDSTLTRKTTAMRMVIEIIGILDKETIVATEGTAEGLLTALESRPNRTSMFYKDEISGFFDSINRKDYLAGMPETLTALYDVPPFYSRRLRKDTIYIENPVFVFFGGGVREKVYETITDDYVLSGFLPRFLVVAGDADLTRLRRTGPANHLGTTKKQKILSEISDLYEKYAMNVATHIGGQKIMMPARIMAELTPDAWSRYGDIEMQMATEANSSSMPTLALPTFERLSRSLLKMSMILGAARQEPRDDKIDIELRDVDMAAWYIQQWGKYSIELIENAGKKSNEKMLEKVKRVITDHPGILKSTMMQHYHLTKREADEILMTLEDRQVIRKEPRGRGYAYWVA